MKNTKKEGFSLIETVIAITLIAIAAVASLSFFVYCDRLALQSDARITAANFCRGTVANFYEIDYSDASLNATTTDKDDPLPAGSGFLSRYPTATRKYAITDRSDYKLITVKVKW